MHADPLAGYTAAHTGAALIDESNAGRMLLRGRDRAALPQRLSTGDVARLKPGQGGRTVFTSPIGRILDLASVYARDDTLLLLTESGRGAAVFGLLKRNIFFNDQVTLEALGRSHAQFALIGPAVPALLATLGADPAALPAGGRIDTTLAELPVWLLHTIVLGTPGYRILVPAEHAAALRAALETAGAVALSDAATDVVRVEHGGAGLVSELSEEFIPLETGLDDAISFTKGCYVGQEIIARMESRGRMAKRLCRVTLAAPLQAPQPLTVDGKDAGVLTSAVVSPQHGPLGLAYVRTAYAEVGTRLLAGTTDVVVVADVLEPAGVHGRL